MVREEEEGERKSCFGPRASRTSLAATAENNELTSRLVTSRENMAARADTPQIRNAGSIAINNPVE